MKKILALSWVTFMVLLTFSALLAILAGVIHFITTTVGWLPILAIFGLGAGMTILFKITSWADEVLAKDK